VTRIDSLAGRLARLGFGDPSSTAAIIQSWEAIASPEDAIAALERLTGTADPDLALAGLHRLVPARPHLIADLAADLRAPTPSAAAAAVVPDAAELAAALEAMTDRLAALAMERLVKKRQELARAEHLLRLHDPRRMLAQHRQRLDEQMRRAVTAVQHQRSLRRLRLAGLQARLEALDTRAVLARGYAIIRDGATGTVLRSARRASPGQAIGIDLHDGHLGAMVTSVTATEHWA